ncbi:MAG: hypothetical protein ACRDKZ_10760 [Actinomycetota bacterium]
MKRYLIVLAIVTAVLVGTAAPAWAPRTFLLPPLQDVPCRLPDGSAATFAGDVTINRFFAGKDGLAAETELAGACSNSLGSAQLDEPNELISNVAIGDSSCDSIDLRLGPTVATIRSEVATIQSFELTMDNPTGSRRMRAALCVASLLPRRTPVKVVALVLNFALNAE